jgi:hypothetical protein
MKLKLKNCKQYKSIFIVEYIFIIILLIGSVAAARLPSVGGDEDNWGTVLNGYLNSSLGENATSLTIPSGNITLGQRITFALGEIIDNIVNGWVRVTGSLNVTENINAEGNVTADYFIGDGSQLTGISSGGGGLISNVNVTSGTYTGAITSGADTGYKAADDICDSEFSGSHFCTEFEIATWSSKSIDGEDAWVIAGGPKYVPADIPVNDCNGWTHGSAGTYLGNYWHFDSTTGGDGRAINCGTLLKLACCSY